MIWLWLLFSLVLFVLPLGYGWAYRDWPAYASGRDRRRLAPAQPLARSRVRLADVVWFAALIAAMLLTLSRLL